MRQMMPRPLPAMLGGAMIAMALPVCGVAQTTAMICKFQTECVDDNCTAARNYQATVSLTPASIDAGIATLRAEFADGNDTFTLAGMDQNGLIRLFNIETAAGARLLTIWPDGVVRYTTHSRLTTKTADLPMAITYLGRCNEG